MNKKIVFFLTSMLLLFFLSSRIFFFRTSFLETTSSYVVYPALKFSNFIAAPVKRFLHKRSLRKELFKNYTETKKANEDLLEENIKLKAMLHYDKKSKALLEFESRYDLKKMVLSKILVKTITDQEHSFLVNRGSRHGIKKNMVAVYKFQLVGRVSHVTPCYSKVTLITDSLSKVSAYANTSSARGIVEGSNKIEVCHLKHISHINTLHNGDFVLSSGQGLVFPEGLCLGKIINIKHEDICYYVELKPLIDLKTLEMCHLTDQSKMNLF